MKDRIRWCAAARTWMFVSIFLCLAPFAHASITVTGAAADLTTFTMKLSACTNGTVTLGPMGAMAIAGANMNACGILVQTMINAPDRITIEIVNKKENIFVGAFQPPSPPGPADGVSNGTQIIDIDDICNMPTLTALVGTAWSGMIHEMYECYISRTCNLGYDDAHKLAINRENMSLQLEGHALRQGGTRPPPPTVPPKMPCATPSGGWDVYLPTGSTMPGYTHYDLEGRPTSTPMPGVILFGYLSSTELGTMSLPVPHDPVTMMPLNDVYLASADFIPYDPGAALCFGDGLDPMVTMPCPCGNTGTAGHGCANSVDIAGALLNATGSTAVDPMTGTDTVVLHASQMPGMVTAIFLKGSGVIPTGAVFGAGIRCAGDTLIRLGQVDTVGGAADYPTGTQESISVNGGTPNGSGTSAYYQTYYRNAAATFCPPATFNISNGYRIMW